MKQLSERIGVIKDSCAVLQPPSHHWFDVLVIEVDEVGAVHVIGGAPGRIRYLASPMEQCRSRYKGSSNPLVTILIPTSLGTDNEDVPG